MNGNPDHLYYVALAYLAATVVIVFLVLQSLFAAAAVRRALEDAEKTAENDAGDQAS
jgi:heme exporter protein CcmD